MIKGQFLLEEFESTSYLDDRYFGNWESLVILAVHLVALLLQGKHILVCGFFFGQELEFQVFDAILECFVETKPSSFDFFSLFVQFIAILFDPLWKVISFHSADSESADQDIQGIVYH